MDGDATNDRTNDVAADANNGEHQGASHRGLSRRGLLGLIGAGGAAIGVGGTLAAQAIAENGHADTGAGRAYSFYGTHQSGITTPAQDRLHFAAFDMTSAATRTDLMELLQDWSFAANRLMLGEEVAENGASASPLSPPKDSGEAVGLPASGLTITIGVGPTLFRTAAGVDRYGIAAKQPSELTTLPGFRGDLINAAISGGDLCIQACADDPQVAVHAIRNLTRIAFGRAQIRWSQLGFGRTSSTSSAQETPRNLFGFKDGTANIKSEDTATVNTYVWAGSESSVPWMVGGSYLVARKIRMTLETWDRSNLREQERITGRDKAAGAPLSGGTEFTAPNFAATNAAGTPLIARTSHVFLAHAEQNNGTQILRRGYNYVDGTTELGQLDAGLFFISYQSTPQHFITIQNRLATSDAMNEYIRHISSAVFAVPPAAASASSYVGAGLFS